MASFISWGNQFYTIIRTQLIVPFDTKTSLTSLDDYDKEGDYVDR